MAALRIAPAAVPPRQPSIHELRPSQPRQPAGPEPTGNARTCEAAACAEDGDTEGISRSGRITAARRGMRPPGRPPVEPTLSK
jgi:hypothetical protein